VFCFYPAIHSMGGILSLLWLSSFILYHYRFLNPGFTDQREILHGSSAISQTGLLLFWGDSARDGWVLSVQQGLYGGICFLMKHFSCFWLLVPVQSIAWKDSSLKWPIKCWVGHWTLHTDSLTWSANELIEDSQLCSVRATLKTAYVHCWMVLIMYSILLVFSYLVEQKQ